MGVKIKLGKFNKLTKDENGKTRIVTDHEKVRRSKPAGQQFFKKDTVRVKR